MTFISAQPPCPQVNTKAARLLQISKKKPPKASASEGFSQSILDFCHVALLARPQTLTVDDSIIVAHAGWHIEFQPMRGANFIFDL